MREIKPKVGNVRARLKMTLFCLQRVHENSREQWVNLIVSEKETKSEYWKE